LLLYNVVRVVLCSGCSGAAVAFANALI
jgi:hypothetical protein